MNSQNVAKKKEIFIGPNVEHLDVFGDKVKARTAAQNANIPIVPGKEVETEEDIREFAAKNGYPIIIKAALGGGGRGMRIVQEEEELSESYQRAKSEAKTAFGNDEVYVEKLISNPKHIEVQILGDRKGNIVHLYERDCSVQRRHQKVVEIAPSVSLSEELREEINNAAVQLMKHTNYINAGTVEFLVSDNQFYFIEVNPRIQVEHTITELITGIDIVQSQIYIAEGYELHSPVVGIPKTRKYSKQVVMLFNCTNYDRRSIEYLMPDTGKLSVYRLAEEDLVFRLDAGNAFQGAVISPYYDSLLVKVSTHALTFEQAAAKMVRNSREFRIRGIKTNIAFLINVMKHPKFINGEYDTSFIDTTPELFKFPIPDRGTKLLAYIADVSVNGLPLELIM